MVEPKVCPVCASPRIAEIVDGYPTPETEERAHRGEVILGGDIVFGDELDHTWQCRDCGRSWAMLQDEDEEEVE